MVKPELLRRAGRWARLKLDRAGAPYRNRRLDEAFQRDPAGYLDRMDAAVSRGIEWFADRADVSMSVLYVAKRSLERGVDSRFGFVHEKMERYRTTLRDPAFRMLDKSYDPADPAYADLPDVMDVRPYWPIELLMIDATWADVRHQPDIIDRLRGFDDMGMYGTTHIVVGGLLLLENNGAPAAETQRMIDATIETIRQANDGTTRADDIFAERAMVLQWLERHDLVRPAWAMRLLMAQKQDGGWSSPNFRSNERSNEHTTIIATAVLADFRRQLLGRSGQVGNASAPRRSCSE